MFGIYQARSKIKQYQGIWVLWWDISIRFKDDVLRYRPRKSNGTFMAWLPTRPLNEKKHIGGNCWRLPLRLVRKSSLDAWNTRTSPRWLVWSKTTLQMPFPNWNWEGFAFFNFYSIENACQILWQLLLEMLTFVGSTGSWSLHDVQGFVVVSLDSGHMDIDSRQMSWPTFISGRGRISFLKERDDWRILAGPWFFISTMLQVCCYCSQEVGILIFLTYSGRCVDVTGHQDGLKVLCRTISVRMWGWTCSRIGHFCRKKRGV
jgi:hypothetical protein